MSEVVALVSDESGEPIYVGESFYLLGNGDRVTVEEFEERGEAWRNQYDDWCRYVATGKNEWRKP